MSVSEGTQFANYNNHIHSSNSDTHALLTFFLTAATPHVWNIAVMYFRIKINLVSYGVNYFLFKNMPFLGFFKYFPFVNISNGNIQRRELLYL